MIHLSTRMFSPKPGQRNWPFTPLRNQFTLKISGGFVRRFPMSSQCWKYSPMLYPQNGSIAIGSRRTLPTAPAAAAVVSDPIVAPRYTPLLQLNAWYTSGSVVDLRPPNTIASIGTPSGDSQFGSMLGHCFAGAVNLPFGCAAVRPVSFAISGVHFSPRQSSHSAGGVSVIPSHHTPPSGVSPTLVKIEFFESAAIAIGFVFTLVPGAT